MGTTFSRDGQLGYIAKAENDLSAKQFHLVEISGDSQIDVTDDDTDVCGGVLVNKPASGRFADVVVVGVTPVQAGVAITAGDKLWCASGGWARNVSTTGSGVRIIGFAISGASSGGQPTAFINCANAVSSVTSTP